MRQNGFWVLSANTVARSLIFKCVKCRKFRGKVEEQKMANLPKERLSDDPPFSHCGVDMFGPFVVKDRRSDLIYYLQVCFIVGRRR